MIIPGNDTPCFFCRKPIEQAAVQWEEEQFPRPSWGVLKIMLHPRCAVMLGERLIGDGFCADPTLDGTTVLKLVEERINRYQR